MRFRDAMKMASNDCADIRHLSDSEINCLHMRQLKMLNDFDGICRTENIEWALGAGNLLGAVRHQGFIPWDDDIDVTMTRSEFEKLKKVFSEIDSAEYELKCPGDSRHIFHFPRIYAKGTKYRNILSVDNGDNELYMDIFLDENVSDNRLIRGLHGVLCTAVLGMISAVRVYYCRDTLKKLAKNSREFRREVKVRSIPGSILSVIPIECWMKMADKCFSLCKNSESENICIPSGAKHFFGEIYDREKFCSYKRTRFENSDLPIPADPEYYLSIRYGTDYMTPPPEEDRERSALIEYDIS